MKDTALTSYDAGVQKSLDGRHTILKKAEYAFGVLAGDTAGAMAIHLAAVPRPTDLEVDDITYAVGDLVAYMAPFKALQRIKRYLRRSCRKPGDVTARQVLLSIISRASIRKNFLLCRHYSMLLAVRISVPLHSVTS